MKLFIFPGSENVYIYMLHMFHNNFALKIFDGV